MIDIDTLFIIILECLASGSAERALARLAAGEAAAVRARRVPPVAKGRRLLCELRVHERPAQAPGHAEGAAGRRDVPARGFDSRFSDVSSTRVEGRPRESATVQL